MKTKFRNYTNELRFTEDFQKVSDFLKRIIHKEFSSLNFSWVRWEWAISHPGLDETNLGKIGIWEDADSDAIVGLSAYEIQLGAVFLIVDPAYFHVREEMLRYAIANLCNEEGKINVYINNNDRELQLLARKHGLRPTQYSDVMSVIEVKRDLDYTLPESYSIISMTDEYDLYKIHEVMYKGFNNGDDVVHNEEEHQSRHIMFSGPNQSLDLKIIIKAPNGEYAAICGGWYDPVSQSGQIEPLCTVPKYRKMGLGKAAVLETVIRCGKLGAKRVYVGSSQQFYYNIGFDPVETHTVWK
jgi:hypothetical protein